LSDRPQGTAVLAALKPGDVVIIGKLDRMFRSALDALDVLGRLKEGGINLHMIDLGGDVTGNGVSKLVFTILSAVAEAERDRTRDAWPRSSAISGSAGDTWAARRPGGGRSATRGSS
jgi:putative DNA-invertase from lambdoid prophage Rac